MNNSFNDSITKKVTKRRNKLQQSPQHTLLNPRVHPQHTHRDPQPTHCNNRQAPAHTVDGRTLSFAITRSIVRMLKLFPIVSCNCIFLKLRQHNELKTEPSGCILHSGVWCSCVDTNHVMICLGFVTAEDGKQPFWLEPCKQVTSRYQPPLLRLNITMPE